MAALESQPLLGFFLREEKNGPAQKLQFKLYHKNTLFYIFKADDIPTAQRYLISDDTFQIIILQKISVPVDFTRGYCGNSKCSLTLQQTLLGQLVCSSTRAANLKLFGERKQYL